MSQTASPYLEELFAALRLLPGIGPRSSQRIAYYLLQYNPGGAARLAKAISEALQRLRSCRRCNNYSEDEVCLRCRSGRRDESKLCVVEMPVDLNLVEQSNSYDGLYYVLMGRLSPLDAIGPEELNLKGFYERVSDGKVKEVILATNFTNEGEATAYYLHETLRNMGLQVSRLARGVPVGGELEYTDAATVAQALLDRRRL